MEVTKPNPQALRKFMYGLVKDAMQSDYEKFLKYWGISNKEYDEVREWFKQFGVAV